MTRSMQMGITHVTIAKDGAAGAEGADGASRSHLVISDHEHARSRRARPAEGIAHTRPTSGIGFILVTGSPDKSLIERGKQFGLNNFVTKPFTTSSLSGAIEAVVGRLS